METKSLILGRRSIRRFLPEPLSRELIVELVELARFAPSWANTRTARWYCISDPERKERLAEKCFANNQGIVRSAPHVMALSAVQGRSGIGSVTHTPREWLMFDAGIAAQTFCLAAWDRGVGTVMLGGFFPEAAEVIGLPGGETLVALIPMGRPAESPVAPRRKEVSEILQFL